MRPRSIMIGAIALAGFVLGALFAAPGSEKKTTPVLINGVSLRAEVAADPVARARGLSGRASLAEDEAMLFLFDVPNRYGFWMKGMRFPLDIFWIRNGVVADLEERVPPPAGDAPLPVYQPDIPADTVLETRAGFAAENNIRIGDRVLIGSDSALEARASTRPDTAGSASTSAGEEYTIPYLKNHPAQGSDFAPRKQLFIGRGYRKFSIAYRSGAMTLTGIMNVPSAAAPSGGFPVLILNHGLIRPEIYYSGRGSRREQDFFASRGYITVHPDYRGYSSTTPTFPERHDFYAGFTDDVRALVDALKKARLPNMDTERIGVWGHSMGGGIAARLMVTSPDIRAYVLFAPISADAEDNFYELSPEEVARLHAAYGPAGDPVYRSISPLTYFSDVSAPVQLHHGTDDKDVPIGFSEKMFAALKQNGKRAEFFTYPGERHEFADAWPLAANRALQFLDRYVKNAR